MGEASPWSRTFYELICASKCVSFKNFLLILLEF